MGVLIASEQGFGVWDGGWLVAGRQVGHSSILFLSVFYASPISNQTWFPLIYETSSQCSNQSVEEEVRAQGFAKQKKQTSSLAEAHI
jgi:hypothetical protein